MRYKIKVIKCNLHYSFKLGIRTSLESFMLVLKTLHVEGQKYPDLWISILSSIISGQAAPIPHPSRISKSNHMQQRNESQKEAFRAVSL